MNIGVIVPRYYPYGEGLARVTRETYRRLAQRGHDITVYSTASSCRLLGAHYIDRVKVRNYLASAWSNAWAPSPIMLTDVLGGRHDILHAHGIHDLTAIVGYLARMSSKFVISPYWHGRGHTRLANNLWAFYRPLVRRMLASADALVVNSETQHTTLSRDFGVSPVKCFLICDGVDQEGIAAAQPFSADAKIILYVGRLEHYKNVALGIHALEMLPKDFSYVIIGEGAFKQKLQHIAENKGLSSRVLLLGYQPDPIVWRWLRTADIFLHLSDVESFGMTCIESLAAGTPVVANDDGFGLSETIKLFPREIFAYRARKESVKDLANLIAHVATMKPVNADVSRFSWNHVANQMETVYRRLATANR